ncbi:hypothetical protein KY290_014244 [Solanum tuberosum]|uniref:RNase H type-1 domain-containing protein n=1 Tax=Solanum tuberosum TaxID=4113 RepID=A0ABQ7VQU9_SOLTU|nr:hypothetical protein KY284_013642 [Solanum tuberosum]KAH0770263.1 hypothetical protein KY290_014244 [Solanum tuberosum]
MILDKREPNWLKELKNLGNLFMHSSMISWEFAFPFYIWNIWLTRNHNHHNGKCIDISTKQPLARSLEYYYLGSHKPGDKGITKEVELKWKPPDIGLKLNIDGSYDYNTKWGGGGGGSRRSTKRHHGKLDSRVRSKLKLNVNCALYSEIMALLMGIKLAAKLQINTLQIETDSTAILEIINTGHVSYTNIIIECRELLRQLGSPQISHSRREQNQVADKLAKEGARLMQGNTFVEWITPPDFVLKTLHADKDGVPFVTNVIATTVLSINAANYVGTNVSTGHRVFHPVFRAHIGARAAYQSVRFGFKVYRSGLLVIGL